MSVLRRAGTGGGAMPGSGCAISGVMGLTLYSELPREWREGTGGGAAAASATAGGGGVYGVATDDLRGGSGGAGDSG